MSYFDNERKTKKVLLPSNNDYWVEVYTDLEYGDVVKSGAVNKDGSQDLIASGSRVMVQMIRAWNLDDADGNVVEINAESVFKLSQRDAQAILDILNNVEVDTPAQKKITTEESTQL